MCDDGVCVSGLLCYCCVIFKWCNEWLLCVLYGVIILCELCLSVDDCCAIDIVVVMCWHTAEYRC